MVAALLRKKQANQTILTQLFPVLGPPPAAPPAAGAPPDQFAANPPPIHDRLGEGRDLDNKRESRDLKKLGSLGNSSRLLLTNPSNCK